MINHKQKSRRQLLKSVLTSPVLNSLMPSLMSPWRVGQSQVQKFLPNLATLSTAASMVALSGCSKEGNEEPSKVWGKRGVLPGEFVRPRAMVFDGGDRIYVVDFSARIQVFDQQGEYIGPTWQTPDYRKGRPSGLGLSNSGELIVCDSHYHCLRFYSSQGELLKTLGGQGGHEPGQFGYISDVVQDEDNYLYVSEYSVNDRITKLTSDGNFVQCWGQLGNRPGELNRARALALSKDQFIYVADACNHRIQIFSRHGEFMNAWGEPGQEPGQLNYPYDICFGPDGNVYVAEWGNHRVQKFSLEGKSLGCWGQPGKLPGQLHGPWALVVDRAGYVHVADTENHRIQKFKL